MRILFVVERPTQFEAPFFRFAAADPEHGFEVLFTRPDPAGAVHDPELGRTISWGIDLTSGYPWTAPEPEEPPALWAAREVRRRRPDLVIVNGYTRRDYLAAALAARTVGAAAALRTDSVTFPGEEGPGLAKRMLVAGPQAGLFRLFLTTGTLGRRYLEACGIPDERIGLFPYAVDVDHFRAGAALEPLERRHARERLGIPSQGRAILALAKMSPREAPWDLLRAFTELPGPDLRLILAGDGPERGALESWAADHDHGNRVLFPGYVPYPELPALYGTVDLFVHPVPEERWGVSVQEALAAGLPVITSSRVGAAHDLIRHGENGFVYPAGDADELGSLLPRGLALAMDAEEDGGSSVEAVNRAILARWTYRAAWREILRAAATAVPESRPDP